MLRTPNLISELKNVGRIRKRGLSWWTTRVRRLRLCSADLRTNYQTGSYVDYTPYIIKLPKRPAADASGTQAVVSAVRVLQNEVRLYHFDTYWSPNAAINLERNSAAGTIANSTSSTAGITPR